MSLAVPVLARGPGTAEALAELRAGGRVLSTHARVLNLRADGGRLLALHPPAVPATPFSLVLGALPAVPWPRAGSPARLQGQTLRLGPLEFDLDGAAWLPEPLVPRPAAPGCPDRLVELLAPFAAAGAFGAWWNQEPTATEPLACALFLRARPAIAALQSASRRAAPSVAATMGLMGLGPGGTPSGDDLLVGFLAAWLRLGPDPTLAASGARCAAELAPGRTSHLAAEFYYHLARGRLSRQLALLLRALALGDPIAVRRAARELAQYGATSGPDLIAGVYAYLRA